MNVYCKEDEVHKIFLSVEAKQREIPINQIRLNRTDYQLNISELEL